MGALTKDEIKFYFVNLSTRQSDGPAEIVATDARRKTLGRLRFPEEGAKFTEFQIKSQPAVSLNRLTNHFGNVIDVLRSFPHM